MPAKAIYAVSSPQNPLVSYNHKIQNADTNFMVAPFTPLTGTVLTIDGFPISWAKVHVQWAGQYVVLRRKLTDIVKDEYLLGAYIPGVWSLMSSDAHPVKQHVIEDYDPLHPFYQNQVLHQGIPEGTDAILVWAPPTIVRTDSNGNFSVDVPNVACRVLIRYKCRVYRCFAEHEKVVDKVRAGTLVITLDLDSSHLR